VPKYIQNFLKVGIAVALIAVIYSFVDIGRTIELMKQISPTFFGLAVLFAILDQVMMGFKWNILLRIFGVIVPNHIPILAYLRGKTFEILAPSTLGIDAYKVYALKARSGAKADIIVSSVVLERFFGALSSLVVIGLLFWFAIEPFDLSFRFELSILALVGTLSIILFVGLLLNQAGRASQFTAWSKLPIKVQEVLTKVVSNLHAVETARSKIYQYLVLSSVEKLSYGIVICCSALAVGGIDGVDYLFILAATPLMALLERLPISFAAIGVREGFFMLLFAPFTEDTSAVLGVALTVRACEMTMLTLLSLTWVGKFSDWKRVNSTISE